MLKQCLKNIGEGLLHACISSLDWFIGILMHVQETARFFRFSACLHRAEVYITDKVILYIIILIYKFR
jgi:hypothetical protein